MTPLHVRDYQKTDLQALVALWQRCDLLRPWNDPQQDIALCLRTPTSDLFVGERAGALAASVMAGSDGHRGWVYYLAVDPTWRRAGLGRRMMARAEDFLIGQGVPKAQLMIRADNDGVRAFYQRLGYAFEDRIIMARRFQVGTAVD